MLNNIPEEFKQYKQWVGWIYKYEKDKEKPTKVPINLYTGKYASPTNPNDWCWFVDLSHSNIKVDGYGFVITSEDPFTCLDFDSTNDPEILALQINIYNAFPNSYAERSPSGNGAHRWIKAKLESNRNRSKVEIYTQNHFMTMTGDVIDNSPIKDYQELAAQLWAEMAPSKEYKIGPRLNEPERYSDYQILEMASSASNGEKFIKIYENNWYDYFPHEAAEGKTFCNEADQALCNFLAFYTQNREQIKRIFRASPLGQRAKANREDYFEHPQWGMLDKAFDQIPEPINLDGLRQNLEAKLLANRQAEAAIEEITPTLTIPSPEIEPHMSNAEAVFSPELAQICDLVQDTIVNEEIQIKPVKAVKKKAAIQDPYSLPPGLMGMIAQFIYESAPRPVPEIALAGAIGLMSGVCGRSYNISGTGLNSYIFLLAKTGRGKEAMRKGINKLIACACKTVPAASSFMGPAKIASPEALIKYIDKTSNSFVSILGEFADTLKKMSNDSRNPQQQGVRIAMLDLYNQSGKGDILGSLIYSDKDKNTNASAAPAFSIVGESTPEKFYELLNKEMITEGLLPRCTIIEYDGKRVQLNENHFLAKPSQQLEDRFSALCAYSLQLNNGNNILEIKINDEAKQLIDNYDKHCDYKVNNGNEISSELWTRAHMKVLKLAGLLAVGCNYINPTVDIVCAEWALKLITHDVESLIARFEVGEVGTASVQNEQVDDLKKAFKKYVTSEWDSVKSYPGASLITWSSKIMPHSFITAYCRSRSSFKNDKLGPIQAIKTCLASMIECDEIRELSIQDKRKNNLPLNAKLYVISGMQF